MCLNSRKLTTAFIRENNIVFIHDCNSLLTFEKLDPFGRHGNGIFGNDRVFPEVVELDDTNEKLELDSTVRPVLWHHSASTKLILDSLRCQNFRTNK